MTRNEILNATLEQLRVLVATEIMGFTNIRHYTASKISWGESPSRTSNPEMTITQVVPDYPCSWAAAGEVVEEMGERGYRIELEYNYPRIGEWSAEFLHVVDDRYGQAQTSTGPEAICKASLIAVMDES